MKVVVIGSSGHIGSYLVPKLVKAGFEVVAVSRGKSQPYLLDPAWQQVEKLVLDRKADKDFADKIAQVQADIVVDLINFDVAETEKMVAALKDGPLSHYLYCSSIWAHGRAEILPSQADIPKEALDDYGRDKYESELYLKEQYLKTGFPATVIMPGQISGPGWAIISPYGNTNYQVFQDIADGKEIFLPNFGMETLHHVHAEDVAQVFFQAIKHRNQALGQSFHAVAKESMTLYGYAKALYRYFNQEAKISFLSWEKWCQYVGNQAEIDHSYYHLARSGHFSIENAQQLIDYHPKYTTLETVEAAVASYIDRGIIRVAN